MAEMITPVVRAVVVHRSARSACCLAPLRAPVPADGHECTECGSPTDLVLGEPRRIAASSAPAGSAT